RPAVADADHGPAVEHRGRPARVVQLGPVHVTHLAVGTEPRRAATGRFGRSVRRFRGGGRGCHDRVSPRSWRMMVTGSGESPPELSISSATGSPAKSSSSTVAGAGP